MAHDVQGACNRFDAFPCRVPVVLRSRSVSPVCHRTLADRSHGTYFQDKAEDNHDNHREVEGNLSNSRGNQRAEVENDVELHGACREGEGHGDEAVRVGGCGVLVDNLVHALVQGMTSASQLGRGLVDGIESLHDIRCGTLLDNPRSHTVLAEGRDQETRRRDEARLHYQDKEEGGRKNQTRISARKLFCVHIAVDVLVVVHKHSANRSHLHNHPSLVWSAVTIRDKV